ncbi:hypothetical protein [Gemmatimonas sp.]|uniref:hypothetical protein n=1 Tax=Gemmatimonas sp. TaxID=1962908 RepID=UPI0035647E43
MTTPAHAGKWVLYDRTTGAAFWRWPVDAREMLATGAYTVDPPSLDATPVDPVVEQLPSAPDVAPDVAPVTDPSAPRVARRRR